MNQTLLYPEYPFSNSNTRYVFSIQQSIRRIIPPYGHLKVHLYGYTEQNVYTLVTRDLVISSKWVEGSVEEDHVCLGGLRCF